MRTKFTTTHPTTGQTATRTSENRTYTHAVWGRETVAHQLSRLASDVRHYQRQAAEDLQKADRGGDSTGRFRYTADQYREWAERSDRAAKKAQVKLEAFQADPQPGKWAVLGWCGRPDLALKLASKESKVYETAISVAEVVAK